MFVAEGLCRLWYHISAVLGWRWWHHTYK